MYKPNQTRSKTVMRVRIIGTYFLAFGPEDGLNSFSRAMPSSTKEEMNRPVKRNVRKIIICDGIYMRFVIQRKRAMKKDEDTKNLPNGSVVFFKALAPSRIKKMKNIHQSMAPTSPRVIRNVGSVPKPLVNSEFQKDVEFISAGLKRKN